MHKSSTVRGKTTSERSALQPLLKRVNWVIVNQELGGVLEEEPTAYQSPKSFGPASIQVRLREDISLYWLMECACQTRRIGFADMTDSFHHRTGRRSLNSLLKTHGGFSIRVHKRETSSRQGDDLWCGIALCDCDALVHARCFQSRCSASHESLDSKRQVNTSRTSRKLSQCN